MRLALAGDWFLPRLGGIELQMRDLALGLRARGHEVEVITPVPGPESVDGIPVHRLGARRLPGAGIVFTADAFRRAAALFARGRYDVIHVHFGIIAPAAYGFTRIAAGLGIPTVATFHSVLRRFEAPLRAARFLLGSDDWNVRWSAVSSVVAASMEPLVGAQPVAILPNGIDTAWWAGRSGPTAPAGTTRIVSVMRLHPRKRPRALLDAVARARDALPRGQAMEVRIFGDGVQRAALRRMISRLGLESTVRLEGWADRETIRRALHQADIFVMPSRLEAFGIAALEARSAGVPVVAMREGGAGDFLRHGIDSILVHSDRELAAALARLAGTPAERRRLAAACTVPPVDFDWAAVLRRHEQAYEEGLRRA